MPVNLQVDSIEVNRLRSHYIKMIVAVWRVYTKHVLGCTCPVFGSFSKDGKLLPSQDLCEAASVEQEESPDPLEFPALNLATIAKETKYTEGIVSQILKLILATCKQILRKRWFQKIKLQINS